MDKGWGQNTRVLLNSNVNRKMAEPLSYGVEDGAGYVVGTYHCDITVLGHQILSGMCTGRIRCSRPSSHESVSEVSFTEGNRHQIMALSPAQLVMRRAQL